MVRCLGCRSQSIVVLHFYSQLVLPPYTVKIRGGRHSTTHGEGSSRWALVLPPYTVKIRGGRSIFLHHSQARVLPSHTVKTGRGRSTRHYHQHWSSISPVWGKWHHWTTLRHLSRWNICIPGPHHSNAAKPTSLLHDRRFVDKIEIYKSKLDPRHAYYINYAWLL